MITGKITRVSGPIVFAEGLEGCGLYDVVNVGEKRLMGEIIRQSEGQATIQVYEDVTGLRIGENVECVEMPLSLHLGPGLVGTIYDGIQRPLKTMCENSGAFLTAGERADALDLEKKWEFHAAKDSNGNEIAEGAPIFPGMVLGTVQETSSILHKVMVPPQTRGRVLKEFLGNGSFYCGRKNRRDGTRRGNKARAILACAPRASVCAKARRDRAFDYGTSRYRRFVSAFERRHGCDSRRIRHWKNDDAAFDCKMVRR